MIKNPKTVLAFTCCALILASMLSCAATGASAAQNQEIAQQVSEVQQKTTGQRIISGLAHTALLGSSCIYFIAPCFQSVPIQEQIALYLVGARGSYGSAQGIYHAITQDKVAPCEEPVTLNVHTAANSALLIPSLFLLHSLRTGDQLLIRIFVSFPSFYTLGTSLKTIYRLAQNHKSNSEAQEPEIHAITE